METYVGADIVDELIASNNVKYGANNRMFIVLNLLADEIPSADVILCRDCLVHFSFRDIYRALHNFQASGSKYLVTTTFTRDQPNTDIRMGDFRPINLSQAPFSLPAPIRLINEGCTEQDGIYSDKCLSVWRLSDLPEMV